MKEITEIKLLETNKICVHYGKQIEVLTLKEFNNLMKQRIKKTNKENESRQRTIIYNLIYYVLYSMHENNTNIKLMKNKNFIPSALSLPVYYTKKDNKIYFDFDLLNKEYNKQIKQLKIIENENRRIYAI